MEASVPKKSKSSNAHTAEQFLKNTKESNFFSKPQKTHTPFIKPLLLRPIGTTKNQELIQKQSSGITSERIEELRQLARNPKNFAFGRNRWGSLSLAEKGAVEFGMDGYYGRRFTTVFMAFASNGQLNGGGICLSRGGTLGEACYQNRNPSLWRAPRFHPQYPNCETLIYPDGTEFARCAARTPDPIEIVRQSILEARRIQREGDDSSALVALEQGHSAVQQIESEEARQLGLPFNIADELTIREFLNDKGGVSCPLITIWLALRNELRGFPLFFSLEDDNDIANIPCGN